MDIEIYDEVSDDVDSNDVKGLIVLYVDIGQLPPARATEYYNQTMNAHLPLFERLRNQGWETMGFMVRVGGTRVERLPLT